MTPRRDARSDVVDSEGEDEENFIVVIRPVGRRCRRRDGARMVEPSSSSMVVAAHEVVERHQDDEQ